MDTFLEIAAANPRLFWLLVVLAATCIVYQSVFARPIQRFGQHRARSVKLRRHGRLAKLARKATLQIKSAPETAPSVFAALDPYAFEYLITQTYQSLGNETRKIRRLSGDGGIDGMVRLDGRWHVLQAKRYCGRLGTSKVQEFIDTTRRWKMPGILVISGEFTAPALALGGKVSRVSLVDGRRLAEMVATT